MAQQAGRITCPRCGANNFDTVTACWKCHTPLTGVGGAVAPMPASPSMPGRSEFAPPPVYSSPLSATGDPRVARRAAIWLAITMPYIGLPIGWAFMMMEDRQRQAIGRYCVIWSSVAMVFHLLLLLVTAQTLVPTLQSMLGVTARALQQNHSLSGGGLGGGSLGGM